MSAKPIIHGRDHRPGGADPIPKVIANDWIQAHAGFTVSSDGGAPASPSFVDISFPNTTLDNTSDTALISDGTVGDVFAFRSGTVDTIACLKVGGYVVTAIGAFPQGMSGYIAADADIGGDAWLGLAQANNYVPASYSGTGGGVVVWKRLFVVQEASLAGGVHEVTMDGRVWQNSGSSQTGTITLVIERLTDTPTS